LQGKKSVPAFTSDFAIVSENNFISRHYNNLWRLLSEINAHISSQNNKYSQYGTCRYNPEKGKHNLNLME
jgi:hypothetical protein